jgi:hypothetical protein
MPSLSILQAGVNGLFPVTVSERDFFDVELVPETDDEVSRITAQACRDGSLGRNNPFSLGCLDVKRARGRS